MKQRYKPFLIGLVILNLFELISCVQRSNYPKEPVIKFENFEQTLDTAYLSIRFTDGDGDLGLNNRGDTLAPYNAAGKNYFNVILSYYSKRKNKYLKASSYAGDFRFDRLKSQSRSGELAGVIKLKMFRPYHLPNDKPGDTIKYEFYMKDRALNQSNIENTGDIIVKYN